MHSRRVAVVGADDVAEEGAGGFSHELVVGAHSEDHGVAGEGGVAFAEDLPAEADRGSPQRLGLLALDHAPPTYTLHCVLHSV